MFIMLTSCWKQWEGEKERVFTRRLCYISQTVRLNPEGRANVISPVFMTGISWRPLGCFWREKVTQAEPLVGL